VLERARQHQQALHAVAVHELAVVEAVEEVAADLERLQQQRHGGVDVHLGLALAAGLGVRGHGLAEVVGQAEVVHHQAAGLVAEDAVDARDGLHQPVALHRLVDVERVHRGRVEAGQPHVAHDHHAQRVRGVAEAGGQRLAARRAADVVLEVQLQRGRAGHHHLHGAGLVAGVVPLGAERGERVVHRHADAARHTHHHRLAGQRLGAALEVLHDVLGDERDALLVADHRLELRPSAT
jgi:hypothetical protein